MGVLSRVLFALLIGQCTAANPIRRVVDLLQGLRNEVDADGVKSKQMYEKYMCYCDTSEKQLSSDIEQSTASITELEATIKELTGSNAALESDITEVEGELADNSKALEDATGVREKEAAEYTKEATEMTNSIAALDKAIPAIEAGMEPKAALLQMTNGQALVAHAPSVEDHALLQSILQSSESHGGPGSSQILGILQQMRDNFKEDLAAAMKKEEDDTATFEQLKSAKSEQTTALDSELREKKSRLSEQSESLSADKQKLADTKGSLTADEDFLRSLKESCVKKTSEFETAQKERNMEVQAIGEAIGILNDDSALDLFKKTLPTPQEAPASFLQVSRYSAVQAQQHVLKLLKPLAANNPAIALVQVAMRRSRQEPEAGFGPVKTMITNMIANLKQQQVDDEEHKSNCKDEMSTTTGGITSVGQHIETLQRQGAELTTTKNQLQESIDSAKKEIDELDEAVKSATEQRKEENSVFTSQMSELTLAQQLLNKAKSKLEAMYAPPQEFVQQGEEVHDSNELQMDQILGIGASFVQISMTASDMLEQSISELSGMSQSQAPDADVSHSKKTGQGMSIISIMDEIISDTALEQQTAERDEAEAQKDYEELLAESEASRQKKSREVVAFQEEKAGTEERIQNAMSDEKQATSEQTALKDKMAALHQSCDFMLENFDLRKKARNSEVEAMQQSLAVLSGADFGFTQASRSLRR